MIELMQEKLNDITENDYIYLLIPIVVFIILPLIILNYVHPFDVERSFNIDISSHDITIGSEKNLTQAAVYVNSIKGYGYKVSLSAVDVPQNIEIAFQPQYGEVPPFGSIMEIRTSNATKTKKDHPAIIKIIGNGSDNRNTNRTQNFNLTID